MFADLGTKVNYKRTISPAFQQLKRPYTLITTYDRENIRPDIIAGLTVAVILLPQAIAFALIAELPPKMGLYAAIIGALIGALWGSSNQLHTGPTNAISLLVFASLATIVEPGTQEFIVAAGLMAIMVGILQLFMGLARLGIVVNFVSHSVIVGFATGAGILIAIKQIKPLLGLDFEAETILETLQSIVIHFDTLTIPTAVVGFATMFVMLLSRRINKRLPAALIGMIVASALVGIFSLQEKGVMVIGELPASLPPLSDLPIRNINLIGRLSAGALAVAAIGLVETTAIARSVATQTGQRLDSNQEFVGQGLANIGMGFFSGYAGAGSFSRTAVNFDNGAKSSMAAIFSAVFVLIAMFTLGPLAAFLPVSALAGVLIITAYGMIDRTEIKRILQSNPGEAVILIITFLGTLFLDIEFAVLLGIILSFVMYILKTSAPRVHEVKPDNNYKHFLYQPEKASCSQLGVIEILGDLYFGAVHYVEEYLLDHAGKNPEQRYLLIRMHNVNNCDFSGIHMLESVIKTYRDRGGDVFLVRPQYHVKQIFATTNFVEETLGEDNVLDKDSAIPKLFHHVLDPAVCIYECPVRVFKECTNLPKRINVAGIPQHHEIAAETLANVPPRTLWQQLQTSDIINQHAVEGFEMASPIVIDVREPREYKQGHIAQAQSIPLATVLTNGDQFPLDKQIILVCRSGRRSRRAAAALEDAGCVNVVVLEGGMQAWEAEGLLEAIEQ
ncbi:MAG: STAS domain-containing protein [Chloroflexi bacterium]|nr:STAS domain-containing protein [Chloroflexota bacterium]